jgi:hypothetical protein
MTQVPRLRTERVNSVFSEMNTGFLAFRTEDIHGFLEPNTGFSAHREARGLSAEIGLVVLLKALYALRQSGGMGKEPLSWLILVVLFACTRVDTCHPWNCMHSISMHSFPFGSPSSFPKNLG